MITLAVVLSLILALYLLGIFIIGWFCIHPLRIPLFLSASALGLAQETVTFKSEDGVDLRGWWISPEEPKMVCVLSHGYIMNRAECIPLAKRLYESGVACLVYDFRAHGTSSGKKSTIGSLERYDVKAAVKLAQEKFPNLKVLGYGSSMGGAATILAASEVADSGGQLFDAIVIDSTYRQLHHTNKGWWHTFLPPKFEPIVRPVWLVCWMLTRIDPRTVCIDKAMAKIRNTKILIMHGDADLIAPLDQAKMNTDSNPDSRLEVFENCQHSQARYIQTKRYDQIFYKFVFESLGINLSDG